MPNPKTQRGNGDTRSTGKYHNKPTTIDGIRFASLKEAGRYRDLKLAKAGGLITDLELQPRFRLDVNGTHICDYVGDFRYKENGETVIEDAKGFSTPVYRLKRKLMEAIYGVVIREV